MNLTSEEKNALDIVMNNKAMMRYIVWKATVPKKAQDLEIGETLEIDGIPFSKFMEDNDKNAYMLADEGICKMEFGTSDDWRESPIRTMLNTEFYDKVIEKIGINSLDIIQTDLLSCDGLKDYEVCGDSISLLSLDLYRKSSKNIKMIDDTWWLLTPNTLNTHSLLVSYSDGRLDKALYNKLLAVRPFFIIKADVCLPSMLSL